MDVDQADVAVSSNKKSESPDTFAKNDKKSDRKSDAEDPKPRIVLTFRSEKPGAKSSNMKIVSTEEKREEFSPRRSSRTRTLTKWDSDDDNESLISPKKSRPVSETDDVSDSAHTSLKRSTQHRSKDCKNVTANSITRTEKSNETPVTTRLYRRIKPTAKVLANEELRIGLESQNNARLGIQTEKSPEEGARPRRSGRARRRPSITLRCSPESESESVNKAEQDKDIEGENRNQVMKLKHLCELGLKAINPEGVDNSTKTNEKEVEAVESETIEIDDEDEEIDDDSEVISQLLQADREQRGSSEYDSDFYVQDEFQDRYKNMKSKPPRRSRRLCVSGRRRPWRSPTPESENDKQSVPCRRSGRKIIPMQWLPRSTSASPVEDKPSRSANVAESQSDLEVDDDCDAAGGEEGSEAACPEGDSTVVAACYCETPSNVYAAPSELTEPVFCQAVETVDGVRVGCSHGARREPGGGRAYAAMLRAGPRTPFILACTLHYSQLRKHMCCPTCALFCSQGTFYQCSKGHFFHLECGLPYTDSKARISCPHCGVNFHRWVPVNRECVKVKIEMKCSNKRIFLPEQREQCTPAYLGFSTLDPAQLEQGPVIPEDLLPSPPIDLQRLCEKPEAADREDAQHRSPVQRLYDAVLAGESVDQLIPKIVSCGRNRMSARMRSAARETSAHAAARRGHLAALYLLQYAGADLNATDAGARTPLMAAVLALLDKSDNKSSKKPCKVKADKDPEPMEVDEEDKSDKKEKVDDKSEAGKAPSDVGKPNDADLLKVIRYLVAAGCDVNLPGPDGMTALHMAAQHGGEAACAAILGTASAEIDARDHGGWSPLVWAAENCHAPVTRLLLSHGANAAAADNEGNAAVHWCALAGSARSLQMLLDAAPDAVAALNAHTDTPLHVAARQGHYACVVILLARGARTDVENSAGELPVEVCSGQCQSAISLNMQMSIAVADKFTRRRILSSDISNGRETHPVPCINEIDDTALPDDFTYVTSHVTPRAVTVDCTTESLQGCSCTEGDCSTGSCACCVLGVRRWLARGRLQPDFPYHDPPMLFECNQTCACNAKKCSNSVVSRLCGRGSVFVRAMVFRAGGARGWGLRAAAHVPRGAPVATYCGELLTMADADQRSADQYMFALDIKPDLLEQCLDKVQLCVDAARYGGAARFVNHSCRPNLAPVRVFTHTRDLRLPTVTLFATTDIAAGDELTFDYGDKFWSVKSKWMKCECDAPDCRHPAIATDETEA